ncbi:MAG: serine/threonine-protein kinase [Polyangiales bacterium]
MSQGYYNPPQGPDGGAPPVLGGYRLIELLGRGGMGEVWRAEREGPQGYRRRAAVKRILARFESDPTLRARFVAEARITARLEHPNIVQVLDFGEAPEPYLALEFIEGTTVARVLKACAETGQRIPPAAVLFMLAEAAKGLDYAHRKRDESGQPLGIVHRDVSPQNLLISVDGAVKVSDFGIARAADNSLRTAAGVQVGKLSYMAPEQAQGLQVDHRADVFSLGVVLWETLLVRPLLPRNDPNTALQMLMTGAFEPPSRVDPRLSPVIDQIVMSALAVNPAQRTPSAGDLSAQLQTFVHAISPGFDAAELVRVLATLMPAVAWHSPGGAPRPASLQWAPGGVGAQPAVPSYAEEPEGETRIKGAAVGNGAPLPIGGAQQGGGFAGAALGGLPPRPATMPPSTGGAALGGGNAVAPLSGVGLGGVAPLGGALPPPPSGGGLGNLGGLPPVSQIKHHDEGVNAALPTLEAPPKKPFDRNKLTTIITVGIVVLMVGAAVIALVVLTSRTNDPAARRGGEPVVSIDTVDMNPTPDPSAPTRPPTTSQTTQVTQGVRVPPGYEQRAVRAVESVDPAVQTCLRTVRSDASTVSAFTDFDNASGGVINVALSFGDAGTSTELQTCVQGALSRARFTPDAGVTGITRVTRGWRIRRGSGGGGGGGGASGTSSGPPAFPFGNRSR